MRKEIFTLLALGALLTSCGKVSELYGDHAYNSPNFMENYYCETNGVRELEKNSETKYSLENGVQYFSSNSLTYIKDEDKLDYPWANGLEMDKEFGRNKNLSKIDNSFAYGYLSKLYDGRVRCEGKYQLSRVQLDKNGYATYFPKELVEFKYFALSLRGATDYENSSASRSPLAGPVSINLHINFYKHITNSNKYDVVTFDLNDVNIPCDNGGDTNLVSFYLREDYKYEGQTLSSIKYDISNSVAMSLTYELNTTLPDLSDDVKEEKNHHFAVMLYEVMLPDSIWR